jgi:hypothetical protein
MDAGRVNKTGGKTIEEGLTITIGNLQFFSEIDLYEFSGKLI